jgi:hypothetical protein
MQNRFFYIVFAILLVILITPFIRPLGVAGSLAATVLVATIPLASYYALSGDLRHKAVFALLGIPFVLLDAVSLFHQARSVSVVMYAFGTLMYMYIVVLLLKALLARKSVTTDMIYCAISIYLLIGIMWAGIFAVVETMAPGSFASPSGSVDFIYFSFVTLTTVGYGDVAPLTVLSKRLAVFEAGMGGVYMAIIVALIVGRYLTPAGGDDASR